MDFKSPAYAIPPPGQGRCQRISLRGPLARIAALFTRQKPTALSKSELTALAWLSAFGGVTAISSETT